MKIGILGATGAVGRQMIQCLEEQKIPVDELRLFVSARSAASRTASSENSCRPAFPKLSPAATEKGMLIFAE